MNAGTRRALGTMVVVLGSFLCVPAAAVTTLVLIASLWGGAWTFGHAGPLLLISVPVFLLGVATSLIGARIRHVSPAVSADVLQR